MTDPAHILSIAGSDPSGGAGGQGDIKTFSALGCYGMAVLSALTAQNTLGVQGILPVPPDFLRLQMTSVLDDLGAKGRNLGLRAFRFRFRAHRVSAA